jgi:hypothetical protein
MGRRWEGRRRSKRRRREGKRFLTERYPTLISSIDGHSEPLLAVSNCLHYFAAFQNIFEENKVRNKCRINDPPLPTQNVRENV